MPSLSGTVGLPGLDPIDVDISFNDTCDKLDFGYMPVTEARYERFGVFADLIYTKLSMDRTGLLGLFTADVSQQIFSGK